MRFLQHKCSHCGLTDRIDAAIVFMCPACGATPGDPCIDLRGSRFRQLSAVHAERREVVDNARQAAALQLAARAS
jgi:predicted RNA-binding Zn-ribbon protein involved in translation (DUF1610 family)